jgi:PD-(D/E)XK nuclease superfamily/Predicted AAA-ATPase
MDCSKEGTRNPCENACGFTEAEVQHFLQHGETIAELDNVQHWYNGYAIGRQIRLYNPWSIANLAMSGVFRRYWIETSSHRQLGEWIKGASRKFKRNVMDLLAEITARTMPGAPLDNDLNGVTVELVDDLRYETLQASVNSTADDDAIYTLLYYAGYLTKNLHGNLVIPNKEVAHQWVDWILPLSESRTQACLDFPKLYDSLLREGNLQAFDGIFQQFYVGYTSYYDFTEKTNESHYHLFMLGMFSHLMGSDFQVVSNGEAGLGRYDICITLLNASENIAVIMEFKKAPNEQNIGKFADIALQQIIDQGYHARLPTFVTKLFRIGISFYCHHVALCGHMLLGSCDGNGVLQWDEPQDEYRSIAISG